MDTFPVRQNNEQYPLLNVENGLDTAIRKPPTTVPRDVRRVLANHWPRILSGYWIAVAIFMALALIVAALALQREQMIGMDYFYDEPSPNDGVFLHHFVPMGLLPPFATYSDFLSDITSKHPSLQINVLFLIDDYTDSPDDLHPGRSYDLGIYKLRNEKDWHRFQLQNENFRYSTCRLSLLMRRTPLKHHWKTIPLSYLPFYIRAYTVWKIGGIGMDLDAFNYQYDVGLDRRIQAILKNHNDGLPEKDYNRLLGSIDQEEENCSLSFARILNETMALFNKVFPLTEEIRTGFLPLLNLFSVQSKYTLDDANSNDTTLNTPSNKTERHNLAGNTSLEVTDEANLTTKFYDMVEQYEKKETLNVPLQMNGTSANASSAVNRSDIADSEGPRLFIFYDLSLLGDKGQPKPPAMFPSEANKYKKAITHLALDSDGSFVAATHKKHEFLAMLFSAGMRKMRPELAIWNTLRTDCANVYQSKVYCNVYRL